MASENKDTNLTATYTSPDNEHFTLTKNIPAPPSSSVQDKTQYLEALRKAVSETQDQVNKELTARMEEDKARETPAGGSAAAKLGADEDKEEENYGEEVQEEED